jgi:hypothetical protein
MTDERSFLFHCQNISLGNPSKILIREIEVIGTYLTSFSFLLFVFFGEGGIEIGSYNVARAGLKLMILLPQSPTYWDYRQVSFFS